MPALNDESLQVDADEIGKLHAFPRSRAQVSRVCGRQGAAIVETLGARRRGTSLEAHIGLVTEIPALVVDAYRSNVLRRKGNLLEAADFDDAAFAGGHLIEMSSVLESDGNNLVTDAGFRSSLQLIDKTAGNRHYVFHCIPLVWN